MSGTDQAALELPEDLPARLQAYFHAKPWHDRVAIQSPPFTVYLHKSDLAADASFGLPDDLPGEDFLDRLNSLVAVFAAHERTLRIQFVDVFAPMLPNLLAEAGLQPISEAPLMVCTPAAWRAAPAIPDLELVMVSSESPLEMVREAWNANARGYDLHAALASDAEVEAFRASLVTARAFTARLDGEAVGAGMFEAVRDGLTELVGITTLAPYRGRGIAACLTAHATAMAFTHGGEVAFLVPENDPSQRVYQRVGFRPYGRVITYG